MINKYRRHVFSLLASIVFLSACEASSPNNAQRLVSSVQETENSLFIRLNIPTAVHTNDSFRLNFNGQGQGMLFQNDVRHFEMSDGENFITVRSLFGKGKTHKVTNKKQPVYLIFQYNKVEDGNTTAFNEVTRERFLQ